MSTLLNCIVLKSYNLEFNERDDDELDWKELSSLSDFSFNGDDDDNDGLDRDDCIQSLAIDDIPYDRDLKYINTPNGARTKPTTIITSNQRRIFQQVQNITAGNAAELVHLDAHYAKLDTLKRDHANKYLVDVSEGRNVLVPQQGQSTGQRKPGRARTRRGGRRAHPKKLLLGRSRPLDGGDDDDEEEEEDDDNNNGDGDQITDDEICNDSDNAGKTTTAQLQKLNKQTSVLYDRVLHQTTTTTATTTSTTTSTVITDQQSGKNEGLVKKYPLVSIGRRNKYDHDHAGTVADAAGASVRFDNHDEEDDEEDDSNGVMATATPPSVPTQQLKVLRFKHDSESYHRHEQTHRYHNGMHDVRQESSHRHLDERQKQRRRNDDTRGRQERRDSADDTIQRNYDTTQRNYDTTQRNYDTTQRNYDTTQRARQHPQDRPRYGDEREQRGLPRRYAHAHAHSRELFTYRNDIPIDTITIHVKEEDDSLHNSTADARDPSNREDDPPITQLKLESSRYHFHSSSRPETHQRNYDSSREQPQRNYDSSKEQPSQRNYNSPREQPPQRNSQRSSYEGRDGVSQQQQQQQRLMINRDQPRHGDSSNIIPPISSTLDELQSPPLSKHDKMTSFRNPSLPHPSHHHHQRGDSDVSTDPYHHHRRSNNYVGTREMTRYNVEAHITDNNNINSNNINSNNINNIIINNNNIRHPEYQRVRKPLHSHDYGNVYTNQDQVQIVGKAVAADNNDDDDNDDDNDDDDDDCNETIAATSVATSAIDDIPIASIAAADPDSARPVPHHGGGFHNSSYAKKVFQSHFKPATVKGSSSSTAAMPAVIASTTTTTTTTASATSTTTSANSNSSAVKGIGGNGALLTDDDVDLNAPTTVEVVNEAIVVIPPSYPTYPTAYRDHPMALPYGGYGGATSHIPAYPSYVAASHMSAYGYAIPMIPPTPIGEYHQHPQDMRYHHSNSKPKHHHNSSGRFNKSYPPNYYKNQRYNNNINNNNYQGNNNNNYNIYQGNNNNNNNYQTNSYPHKSTTTKLDDAVDDEDYSSTSPTDNHKSPPTTKVEKAKAVAAAAAAGATLSSVSTSASTGSGMAAEAIAAALKLKLNPQASEFVPLVGCSTTTMTG
jgi:hypothetical protein